MLGAEIELDAPADDGSGSRVFRGSGRSGSRCTPATCPRTPSSRDWPPVVGGGGPGRARRARPARPRAGRRAWSRRCCPGCAHKLATEPIEDLRVDAEDGYRGGPDAEDDDVLARRRRLAADRAAGTAPPSVGIRAKSLEGPTRRRGVRSLDLFLGVWAVAGPWSRCPKVTDVEQVRAFLPVLDALEAAHGVAVDLELQVETPQAVLGAGRHGDARPDGARRRAPG